MAPKNRASAGVVPSQAIPPTPTPTDQTTNGVSNPAEPRPDAVSVNKKKQKRREKEAEKAKKAASRTQGDSLTNGHPHAYPPYDDANFAAGQDDADDTYSDDPENGYDYEADFQNANAEERSEGARAGKGRKYQSASQFPHTPHPWPATPRHQNAPRAFTSRQPTISTEALRTVQRKTLNSTSIWDTNSNKERAAIKEFWIGLTEAQRKDLVNIEKSHVLQKMKEQQKHSCSCTVCGRKRTAIEEELEILLQDPRIWADPTVEPTPNRLLPTDRHYPSSRQSGKSSHGRIQELPSDNDEDEDIDDGESGEEEDEETYSEEDYSEDASYTNDQSDEADNGAANQFFKFGNSLTVKNGVLSVADDLLKNDGQKFIDMMEHLAERRMQREQESTYAHTHYPPQSSLPPAHPHSHPGQLPPEAYDDADEEEDEDEEEEYDSQEEYAEDAESDDIDHLDENERMEEGRRMFQIFAARMFEQRVVQAYKEKVATDRQNALIAAEESQGGEAQSEARKAKAAEKKRRQREKAKEAKAQKEAAKEEERQRKEAVLREAEEKKKEEQRQKQEEARKRKEAEREALAEKKRKKEAEAQKRIDAERERQAEQERKAREAKAEEKRKREEIERKKREEKEAREKKAQEEREKKAKNKENVPTPGPTILSRTDTSDRLIDGKRPSLPAAAVALPSLQTKPSAADSPQSKIATPALPKPPTPQRPNNPPSRQTSTPQTPEHTPQSKQSLSPRSSVSGPFQPPGLASRASSQQSSLSQTPFQPMRSVLPPPGMGPFAGNGPPGMMPVGYPPNGIDARQGMAQPIARPMGPPQGYHQMPARPYVQTNFTSGMPMAMPSRGSSAEYGGFVQHMPIASPMSNPSAFATPQLPASQHSRQPSSHVDSPPADQQHAAPPPAPIGSQPRGSAPIRRPGSVVAKGASGMNDVDELSKHLGSSALISDQDDYIEPPTRNHHNRQSGTAPGTTPLSAFPGSGNTYEQASSGLTPASGLRGAPFEAWSSASFGAPPASRSWNGPAAGWASASSAFGGARPRAAGAERYRDLESARLFTIQAYKILTGPGRRGVGFDGYVDETELAKKTISSSHAMLTGHSGVGGLLPEDVHQALMIQSNPGNGGGVFHTRQGSQGTQVRWISDKDSLGSPTSGGRAASLAGLGSTGMGPGGLAGGAGSRY